MTPQLEQRALCHHPVSICCPNLHRRKRGEIQSYYNRHNEFSRRIYANEIELEFVILANNNIPIPICDCSERPLHGAVPREGGVSDRNFPIGRQCKELPFSCLNQTQKNQMAQSVMGPHGLSKTTTF
jgi:hypothetical protein